MTTITVQRELLEQALEALGMVEPAPYALNQVIDTVNALRAALAAPQVEMRDRKPLTEEHLMNLLARIHRDGGHYTQDHGIDKSVADADEKIVAWLMKDDGRVPAIAQLTDEQIVKCADESDIRTELWNMGSGSLVYSEYCSGIPRDSFTTFVRRIEAAHDIGERHD
jgi:hypothetical protein